MQKTANQFVRQLGVISALRSIRRRWARVAALSACLLPTACLEPDPDFVARQGDAFDSSTQPHTDSTATTTTSETNGSDESATSESETQSTTSSSTTSSDSTQTTDTASSTSDSSDTLSTATDSTDSTDTNSTSTETETMPRLRYGLEIRNRSLTRALDQQIPIMVEIDHAAMIGRGASFDGRDIEFVSNDGLGNRSVLPFVLDHRSQWGASDTQIWLAIDGEIAANATDVDSYELQISPGLVLHEAYDPNLIFEVFDDFGDGEFSLNFIDRWAAVNLENASGTMSVGSGVLHVEKDPLQKGRLIGINSRSHFRLRSPVLEVSANVQDAGEALSCFTSRVAAFSEDGGNYLYAAGIVGEGGTYLQSYQGGLHTYKTEGKGKSAAAYRDYELRWEVRNLTFVQSGLQVAKDTNDATASAERFGLHLGIEMGSSCGRIQPVAVDYDWVLLRDSMDADPSVQVVEIQ